LLRREEDIPQLKEILEDYMESKQQVKTFISDKRNIALVAKLKNKIIGLVYGYSLTRLDKKAPQFFIYSFDIHPEYQNRSYGSQFMKYVIDWAGNNGFSESFVLTHKDNPRACRVYEKAGMTHSENDCERMYEIKY
jgi:RimJ/RimL family protein N-acetyltransferase